mmetsp:Transcript_4411/g.5080  ORF Transcript_4411/g.5080 Transcript_4411/m.5080 type:complete len:357 (-) Transcript_4411:547-1617(-)
MFSGKARRQVPTVKLRRRRGTRRRRESHCDEKRCFSRQLLILVPIFIIVCSFVIVTSLFVSSEHYHGVRKKYYQKTMNGGTRNAAVLSEEEFPYMGTSMLNSSFAPLGGLRFMEYKDGDTPYKITEELMIQSDELARERREHVKNSMKHLWNGYRDNAFGMDEVKPISGGGNNRWTGLGTTLVDSLDTLWLMDMKEEFYEARDWVRDKLRFDNSTELVSLFETTIRSLGGLLSAYDLSGDDIFLVKAKDLGSRLFKAFEKSPSGIPFPRVCLKTGQAANFNTLWDTLLDSLGDINKLNEVFSEAAFSNTEVRGRSYPNTAAEIITSGDGNAISTFVADAGTLQIEFKYLVGIRGVY